MDPLVLEKLDRITTTVDKIDKTLNDDKHGLKTRVALLEQTDKARMWRERITIGSIIGILIKMVLVALSNT